MTGTTSEPKMVRLLYVDDEADTLQIVQKGLALYGFSVDIATNPEDVTLLDLNQYEMIVLDLRMPKINGFQLYELIKDKIEPIKTKVCFFTAYSAFREDYQKKFPDWNGCFVIKPMSSKALASKLRELLNTN